MSVRLANRRIRLLAAVFAVVFAAALLRAGWLQAVKAQALDRLGQGQHRETIDVPAHRGTLYDRMGVELAIGERATTVYADPTQVRDPRAAALAIGRHLGLVPEKVFPLLRDRSRSFVYIVRKADPEKAAALEREHVLGLGFYPEERRYYPRRTIASEIVGYAGTDNRGLSGLELQLDRTLAGRRGSKTVVRDPFGRAIETVEGEPVRDGDDVTLTLDYRLQGEVEDILQATRARWSAASASAVVLDPRTGSVLAMATEPGFDANRAVVVENDRKRNRTVTDTYEPGSTMKVVTIAAALSSRMVTASTRYTLPYAIQVADRRIHDAEPRGTKTFSVAEILSQSSNVGIVTLALGLGRQRVSSWMERFGFGRLTGIDFPGESRGIVLPTRKWSGSTIGNVPIGQGIAVTPIQMASAYATVANGGVRVQPHLVHRIGGGERVRPPKRRVITAAIAKELNAMLQGVVEEGSGTAAKVPGYRIAGKTGTAAKPDADGGYSDSRYVASFVGIVPAEKPRLVVLVTVDEPRGAIWGGVVAAPAFAEIAKFALGYLEVPPDRSLLAP